MAAEVLSHVTDATLGLTVFQVLGRLVKERERTTSLGDDGQSCRW